MKTYELELGGEVDDFLQGFARRNKVPLAEAVRLAFALLSIADDQKRRGNGSCIGIVRERDDHTLEAISRIIGV